MRFWEIVSKFSKPFLPMVSCVTWISIQVLLYIRLIKEMSIVVQKIIQSTFPIFAMKPILEVQNLK